MMYEKEFSGLKAFYDTLPSATRDIAGLMAYMPPVAMGAFGLPLLFMGVISLGTVVVIGIFAAAPAAAMVALTTDIVPRWKEWQEMQQNASETPAMQPVLRMVATANDPGTAKAPADERAKRATG